MHFGLILYVSPEDSSKKMFVIKVLLWELPMVELNVTSLLCSVIDISHFHHSDTGGDLLHVTIRSLVIV